MADTLGKATPASVNAYSVKAADDAAILRDEYVTNKLLSEDLEFASKFLKLVGDLEQVNIEHSDAAMIAQLLMLRSAWNRC